MASLLRGEPARRRKPARHRRQRLLPRVLGGERVLVAAHGNSLRALIMVLDGLSPEGIVGVELETGVPIVYRLKADSTGDSKEVLKP